MKRKEFFDALDLFEAQKGIKKEVFVEILETALAVAYKKNYGEASNVVVKLSPETSRIEVFATKEVVAVVEDAETQITPHEAKEKSKEGGAKRSKNYKAGDIFRQEIKPKDDFGRIAAMTAKQVVMQKLREVERNMVLSDFESRVNTLMTTIIRRIENETIFVDLGVSQLDGVLAKSDQIPKEKYSIGQKIKIFIKEIKSGGKTPIIKVSRSSAGFVRALFEMEVPEIAHGVVQIASIARDAGSRTKIAVHSLDKNLDPIGACVGNRGERINRIVSELSGEKIDIIEYSEDPLDFIARSLAPAPALEVALDVETREATVIVPQDKLSLAIGKQGQNVRLAARLTEYKIDVRAQGEGEEYEEGVIKKVKKVADMEEGKTKLTKEAMPDLAAINKLDDVEDLISFDNFDFNLESEDEK